MPSSNLAAVSRLTQPFLESASVEYNRYKSDRDTIDFDTIMKTADGMYRCFSNRSLADNERETHMVGSDGDEPRANTASVRFFRLVNQKAALGLAVTNSAEIPWKYRPISNPEVFMSSREAADQAAVHNVLARYSWKRGGSKEKLPLFWNQAYKYSNVPIITEWHQEVRRIKVVKAGGERGRWREVIVNAYPTWRPLPWANLYADIYAGPIENQRCVLVLTPVSWMDIQNGQKNGWYHEGQVAKLRKNRGRYRWDGAEGAAFREDQADNEGLSGYSAGDSDLYLQWDIYQFCPIKQKDEGKGGSWNDKNDYVLYWMTAIGNGLGWAQSENKQEKIPQCIPIRLETDFDPDGEIPIKMCHAIPDDADNLYHMSWAQRVRPQYAVECALWNMAIDNIHGINNPALAYDSHKFNVLPSDFQYRIGQRWDTQDPENNIVEKRPNSVVGETGQLIKMIQEEENIAGNINPNEMGQAFGGRTPATENLNINRMSRQPGLGEVQYILAQLIPFLARKFKSYWQGCAPDELIKAIADEELNAPISLGDVGDDEKIPKGFVLHGEFDVEMDMVDEFMEDFVQAQQELQLIQFVGQSPHLMQSPHHEVRLDHWLRSVLRRMKVKEADEIIIPASGLDGHLRQREELRQMRETGEYIEPQEGEDHDAHIAELEAEILRWNPATKIDIGDLDNPELTLQQQDAANWLNGMVIPHRDAHQAMKSAQKTAVGAGGGTLPAQRGEQTPGQIAGNIPAAALGALGAA